MGLMGQVYLTFYVSLYLLWILWILRIHRRTCPQWLMCLIPRIPPPH